MKKSYRFLIVVLPLLLLAVALTGCGNRSAFIKAKQANAKQFDNEKIALSVKEKSGKAITDGINTVKGNLYYNSKKELLAADMTTTGSKNFSGTEYVDGKNEVVYVGLDLAMSSEKSQLQSAGIDLSNYSGKYLELTNSDLDGAFDGASLKSTGSASEFQAKIADNLSSVLSGEKSSQFKKSGDKISFTYTDSELQSLIKKANQSLKSDKLSSSDLQSLLKEVKGTKVTETLNTKDRSVDNYSIKKGSKTYLVDTKTTESTKTIKVPSDSQTMTEEQFKADVEAQVMDKYSAELSE